MIKEESRKAASFRPIFFPENRIENGTLGGNLPRCPASRAPVLRGELSTSNYRERGNKAQALKRPPR